MPILIDTWLYGDLALYAGDSAQGGYANLKISLSEGGTISDLLTKLGLPTEARGITFINGDLSALPGVQPDLAHVLADGDRVAFFHLRSMWPYQYRHGAAMVSELSAAMQANKDLDLHHATNQMNK
jgi:hypothetical protein